MLIKNPCIHIILLCIRTDVLQMFLLKTCVMLQNTTIHFGLRIVNKTKKNPLNLVQIK